MVQNLKSIEENKKSSSYLCPHWPVSPPQGKQPYQMHVSNASEAKQTKKSELGAEKGFLQSQARRMSNMCLKKFFFPKVYKGSVL